MRGIAECLKYMLNNPMMEISHSANPSSFRRRYNNSDECFEYFNTHRQKWEILTSLYSYTDYSDFDNDKDWQLYDPNPSVDFHVAYMDCLENGNNYYAEEDNAIQIKKILDGVAIDFRLHEDKTYIGAIMLNGFNWKKVIS